MLPNAVPRPNFDRNALISASSFGLPLRTGTAMFAPARTVTVSCTVRPEKTCFQKSAR